MCGFSRSIQTLEKNDVKMHIVCYKGKKHYKELVNIKGYLESNEQVKINYSFNINYFIE